MNEKTYLNLRISVTGIVALLIGALLAWEHFHGGIASHHILAREDMPSFSNAWGLLTLPLLTWFLLYRIQQRIHSKPHEHPNASAFPVQVLYGFLAALAWGIALSVFFTLGYEDIPLYLLIGLLLLSLFVPIYRAECFLGFVIGMTFTFGGVLPIIILSVVSLIGAALYLFIRPSVRFIISKLVQVVSGGGRDGE
jgi:hypothetical protein